MLISMLVATVSYAQVQVTFQVDMNKQTVSSNGVHVAGSFQAAAGHTSDWDPAGTELTDGDGDGVYTVTVNLPADSTYQYKFVNGNAWGSDEGVPSACNVGGNRELKVPSSGPHTTGLVCFGSCDPCPTAVDTIAFTIKVDMSKQTVSSNGVHVAGGFGGAGYANWDPAGIALTDGDGDDVYEVTLNLPEGEYPFKFVNGNAWGSDEGIPGECASGGNRNVKLTGDGDDQSETGFTDSYIAYFGECPGVDSTDYTFMVDMSNQDVSADGVHMAGSFGQAGYANWDPSVIELTDDNNDDVYEVTLRLSNGDYQYKFVNGNAWGSDESVPPACNDNGNRALAISPDGNASSDILTGSSKVCYGECTETCPTILPPIDVTFRVDMSNEIVNSAGVFIGGSFPGAIWLKDSFEMKDMDGDEIYEYTFTDLPVDDYQFKFFNGDCGDDCGETHDFKMSGCGVDNGVGGFNRYTDLNGVMNDTSIIVYVYNSCEESKLSVYNTLPNAFRIYPNPAEDVVNIAFDESAAGYEVSLIDLNGRTLRNMSVSGNRAAINTADLITGVYTVRIHDNDGAVAFHKIIVR